MLLADSIVCITCFLASLIICCSSLMELFVLSVSSFCRNSIVSIRCDAICNFLVPFHSTFHSRINLTFFLSFLFFFFLSIFSFDYFENALLNTDLTDIGSFLNHGLSGQFLIFLFITPHCHFFFLVLFVAVKVLLKCSSKFKVYFSKFHLNF